VEESSFESRFLLHVTDGRVRVWRQPNTAYAERNIVETVPFGGSSVMVWGCVSYDWKLHLITVRSNLNGQIYRQNILEASVVPLLNDSQHISDDFGLFLQIATDGATTVFSKQYYWRTDIV
jgi:hypothetical protein